MLGTGNKYAKVAGSTRRSADLPLLIGVNLAGAEFAAIAKKWRWPTVENAKYYLAKGFSVFRVPFLWERLQPLMDAPLYVEALKGLDEIVLTVVGAGATLILDAHNYGRRDGQIIGAAGGGPTVSSFASFWARMAERYGSHRRVWYGLMNEPYDQDAKINLDAQNAACAAIRSRGGLGKVLFSGIAWTGAHSWVASGNATVMLGARDPLENFAMDMHQYLDPGYGGSGPIALPGAGIEVLLPALKWARENKRKVFIGETNSGPSSASLKELSSMIDVMNTNSDVFLGVTYWAGGGTWGTLNEMTTDPTDLASPIDKPQTKLLMSFLMKHGRFSAI